MLKDCCDKLSYRAAITNPYRNATSSLNLNSTISTHTPGAICWYVNLRFGRCRINTEAYNKGTYLGTKKYLI
jgi:hypothetical protein